MDGIVITGGIHGDETSGTLALPELAALGFRTFGPCNPWGYRHGRRELENGWDLNRRFADPRCAEAEEVRRFLGLRPPRILLDLHEDGKTELPYLIQYGPHDPLAHELVAEMSEPCAPRPAFGPVVGRDGVLRPSRFTVALVGLSLCWPLVYYAHRTFGIPAIVVEVPARWPLDRRLAFHRDLALRCAMRSHIS